MKLKAGNKKTEIKDKVAQGVSKFIIKMQTAFAKFMNKRTENISMNRMKFILIVFFLCGSSLSVYFIITAFSKKGPSNRMTIDRLSVPRYYNKSGDEPVQPDFFISKQEYEEMKAFQSYMDSLHHSKRGIRIYDSIMLNRPGLMDSINKLKELYQQNKK